MRPAHGTNSPQSAVADTPHFSRGCMFGDEAAQALTEFIPYPAKNRKPCSLVCFGISGVLNAPMRDLRRPRKDRAILLSRIADGYDVVEGLADEFINGLRALSGNINAKFTQHRNRFGAHPAGLCAGTDHLKTVASVVPQQSFSHLAKRRVGSAHN